MSDQTITDQLQFWHLGYFGLVAFKYKKVWAGFGQFPLLLWAYDQVRSWNQPNPVLSSVLTPVRSSESAPKLNCWSIQHENSLFAREIKDLTNVKTCTQNCDSKLRVEWSAYNWWVGHVLSNLVLQKPHLCEATGRWLMPCSSMIKSNHGPRFRLVQCAVRDNNEFAWWIWRQEHVPAVPSIIISIIGRTQPVIPHFLALLNSCVLSIWPAPSDKICSSKKWQESSNFFVHKLVHL